MKKAFSLIELSIVILIIGILVAGVTQSSRLVSQMRLTTARSMTQSSPVASIKNLTVWYDAISEKSFDEAETEDTDTITNWYDINPQSTYKYNLTSATSKAVYTANGINGRPALYFSGVDGNGYVNTSVPLAGTEMTTFAVVTNEITTATFRRIVSGNTDSYYFFGLANTADRQFATFYGSGSWNHTGGFGTDSALSASQTYILSSVQTTAGINTGYVNAVNVGSPASTPETKGTTSGIRVSHAALSNQSWKGYIGEIIIFDRALKTEERQEIEKYLSKKWGIKI